MTFQITHACVPSLAQKMESELSPYYFKKVCFQGPISLKS